MSATPKDPRQLQRTLERLVGIAFTEGNAVTVLHNGVEIFPAMLEEIRAAERTVDLMTFVYWKGWPAREFADALSDRARAGLRVRLLIDALGGFEIEDGLVDRMADAGVDVQWFRRPWAHSPFKHNHRCHRKVCVVDERVAFTGGVGIAEEWGGDARNEREWRDTHFRVEGPAVNGLSGAFVQNWAETAQGDLFDSRDHFPDHGRPGDARIQVVRGSATIGWDDLRTVWYVLIRSAQRRIALQTAYFSPDDSVRDALVDAVERGVEVDVLVPGPHWDKRVAQLGAESVYAGLEDHGVRIWNYQPSMLHTKIMVVDSQVALVWSSNVNRRSLDHDEEVAMTVVDEPTVATLERHFEQDLESSVRIELERWRNRSLRQRALEAAVTPIRRWL